MNEHLRRIQLVTRYYDWLQGLRFLPLGLLLLGMAGWAMAQPGDSARPPRVGLAVLGAAMGVGFLLYAVVGAYYRRRFGDVRPSAATKQTRRRMVLTFALAALVVAQVLVLVRGRGSGPAMGATVGLALGAASLWAYWAWMGRFVRHYPPVAGAMLLAAGLHQLGLNPLCALLHAGTASPDWRCDMATFHLVWGLAIVVMSVLDHRLLVRTLRPPRGEEEDASPPETRDAEPAPTRPGATG